MYAQFADIAIAAGGNGISIHNQVSPSPFLSLISLLISYLSTIISIHNQFADTAIAAGGNGGGNGGKKDTTSTIIDYCLPSGYSEKNAGTAGKSTLPYSILSITASLTHSLSPLQVDLPSTLIPHRFTLSPLPLALPPNPFLLPQVWYYQDTLPLFLHPLITQIHSPSQL